MEVAEGVKKGKIVLTILSFQGDTAAIYEPKTQAEEAARTMTAAMKNGYLACEVLQDGSQGRTFTKSDWDEMSTVQRHNVFSDPKEIQIIPMPVGG